MRVIITYSHYKVCPTYKHPKHIVSKKTKLIKVGKLDWDDFATNEEFEHMDEMVKQHSKKHHPQPMLIDVGEQGKEEGTNNTKVASILLSLGKNDKK